jgi:hypothetical protein
MQGDWVLQFLQLYVREGTGQQDGLLDYLLLRRGSLILQRGRVFQNGELHPALPPGK